MNDETAGEAPTAPRLYGDLLAQRLKACGLPVFDQGTVYRTLRQLERGGLVNSFWDTSESGPARRMYSLTQAGEAFLAGWLDALQRYQQFLGTLWGFPPPAPPINQGDAASE